jgi:hypothetical protein
MRSRQQSRSVGGSLPIEKVEGRAGGPRALRSAGAWPMRLEKIAGYWDLAEQGLAAAAARRRSEEALKAKLLALKAKQDVVAPAPAQSVAAVAPEPGAEPALNEQELGLRREAEGLASGRLSFLFVNLAVQILRQRQLRLRRRRRLRPQGR